MTAPHAFDPSHCALRTIVVAALESSLEAMPFIIVAGLIAFAPMGEAMSGFGVVEASISATLAGLFIVAVADRKGLIGGPSLALALMMAATFKALLIQGVLAADNIGLAFALAVALTVSCGLVMVGSAALGIGRVAPLVPYPVLSGLRIGTALLLFREQLPTVMGMPDGSYSSIHPGAIAVAAVTFFAMLFPIPCLRIVPPIVRALVAGIATHQLLALLPRSDAIIGPVMATTMPGIDQFTGGWRAAVTLGNLPTSALTDVLLPTLASMAVLAMLETVASASALHTETGQRSNGRRELLAVAFTNVAGGVFGALPVAGSLEATVLNAQAPARRTRPAALLRCVFMVVLAIIAVPHLNRVPGAVLAGLIVATALMAIDFRSLRQMLAVARSGRSRRIERIGNLSISLTVAAAAVAFGLVIAVFLGAALALLVFVADMAEGPVHRHYTNPIGRSRARRSDQESETLLRYGAAIEVIELQGALFFGSTEQVASNVEVAAGDYIVLDLHRVHRMDLSASRGLLLTCERFWQSGRWLVLAGLRPGVPAWDYLCDRGLQNTLPPGCIFPTLEDALDQAEAELLAKHLEGAVEQALNGPEALASIGMPEAAVPDLLRHMRDVEFSSGTTIVRAGDTSRTLFLLLAGRVEVALPVPSHISEQAPAAGRSIRVATLAPGALFGEMALLSGAPRSADLVAKGQVRCLRLDPEDLIVLRAKQPDSAWHLLRAIALQIEMNLRLANAAIASYED